MKRMLVYGLLAACAYMVFLILQLPAAQLYAWLQPRVGAPVQLYQVGGTLWNGHAVTAIAGKTRIETPAWRFRPRGLLLGHVEYELTGTLARAPLVAVVGRGLGAPLYADDVRFSLPLDQALRFFGLQDIGLDGQFRVDLRHLEIKAGKIAALEGTLSVADAAFSAPAGVVLGSAAMRLESNGDIIKGILKDNGGPLQADGVLIYQPNGEYQLTLGLSARDPNDVQLRQALRFLGPPNAAGKVSLNRRGRIDLTSYL
ncbi:MAG: type II secretion system protein N [Gammaproteobacteria bacterium]|nr:type II secretion system protein N [Gammaproteobacteria bacterium]